MKNKIKEMDMSEEHDETLSGEEQGWVDMKSDYPKLFMYQNYSVQRAINEGNLFALKNTVDGFYDLISPNLGNTENNYEKELKELVLKIDNMRFLLPLNQAEEGGARLDFAFLRGKYRLLLKMAKKRGLLPTDFVWME